MEGFWTKTVIVLLGLHSMNHLLHHQHTPHLYRLGVQAAFNFSRLPKECFVQLRDINIGVLSGMTSYQKLPNGDEVCDRKPSSRAEAEALAFAVQEINKEDLLPNNMKLGFVEWNMCHSKQINLASTVSFLPQTECPGERNDEKCKGVYDVVAVLGSSRSALSISTTRLLSSAKIPLISAYSTSDELSDTDRFPYFLRVVPPDRFQFKAIAELIRLFGWTYVSAAYRSDRYGENGFNMLRESLDDFNICLGTVAVLDVGSKEIWSIAKSLVESHAKVRVVVLITYGSQARELIEATQVLLPNKTFVWIGTEAWSSSAKDFQLYDSLKDSLLVDVFKRRFSNFRDWFAQLKPGDENISPWFQQHWEYSLNCSFVEKTCNRSGNIFKSFPRTRLEYIVDAVHMVANATSRVLRSENCRNLTGSAARNCVTGPRLLRELKATNQIGYSGRLELDSKGDRYGHYSIQQITPGPTGTTVVDLVYKYTNGGLEKVKNVTWTTGEKPPQSYCSKPCAPHHARIVKDVPCCWKCKRCEANQYLEDEGRLCQHCPKFTWPNPNTNYSTCYRLKPRTIGNSNVAGAMVIILALIGLIVSVGVSLYMCSHCANPVIANDRELSFFMLIAITTGYLTIILFYIKPSQNLCRITFLLFSTSIVSIYGALLVRAIDVFRWYIIRKPSSEHSESRTHFMFAVLIAFLQVLLCAVLIAQYQTWHGLTQPYIERPYVANTCIMTDVGLACFTFYSCLILVICFILTIHTPERADIEEKLIVNCVCLILIVWFCFIPAFLLAEDKFHRTIFLALFLFLNCSVVVFGIFLPKVKAVWYGHNKVGVVLMPRVAPLGIFSSNDQSRINTCLTSHTTMSRETQSHLTFLRPKFN